MTDEQIPGLIAAGVILGLAGYGLIQFGLMVLAGLRAWWGVGE